MGVTYGPAGVPYGPVEVPHGPAATRSENTDDFRAPLRSIHTVARPDTRPARRRRQESAMPKITPNLWFDTQGKEAAEFYCSVFPNSRIKTVTHYNEAGPRPAGTVLTVEFEL